MSNLNSKRLLLTCFLAYTHHTNAIPFYRYNFQSQITLANHDSFTSSSSSGSCSGPCNYTLASFIVSAASAVPAFVRVDSPTIQVTELENTHSTTRSAIVSSTSTTYLAPQETSPVVINVHRPLFVTQDTPADLVDSQNKPGTGSETTSTLTTTSDLIIPENTETKVTDSGRRVKNLEIHTTQDTTAVAIVSAPNSNQVVSDDSSPLQDIIEATTTTITSTDQNDETIVVQTRPGMFIQISDLPVIQTTAAIPATDVQDPGVFNTDLPDTPGKLTVEPFPTGKIVVAAPPLVTTLLLNPTVEASSIAASENIFVPIATGPPPSQFASQRSIVKGVGIDAFGTTPIQTNKFYKNLMVGNQTDSVFTYPYSVRWLKGAGGVPSWGLGASHVERNQTVFGPADPDSGAASYYVNPVGLDSVIISAVELDSAGQSVVLTTEKHTAFSVNAKLSLGSSSNPLITFPLVQGISFITGIFNGGSVLLKSGLFFKQISPVTVVGTSFRYDVLLNNGYQWAIYITPNSDDSNNVLKRDNTAAIDAPVLTLSPDGSTITGPTKFSGLVQTAKLEYSDETQIYDQAAGVYAISANVSANESGAYSLAWSKAGKTDKTLQMFALPHHVDSFTDSTFGDILDVELQTTTKGSATLIRSDQWFLQETLADTMGFAPWSPTVQKASLSENATSTINAALNTELQESIVSQTNLQSVYFSGKAFAKFASMIYVASNMTSNGLAPAALLSLEKALDLFISGSGAARLVYDSTWGGIITSSGGTDPNADFGNPSYNDHMFHYGYFVYTAAVIAHLDPSWLAQEPHRAWINSLIRDYANPAASDPFFPFQRSFDWFHGHSWASGLYTAGDGNNLESSSEDTFASYALAMWGLATGDGNTRARGALQLAVQARSLSAYFLLQTDNTAQPAQFTPNRVSGILFDNKVDHTTYFGTDVAYKQGIHMVPLGAHSGLTRPVPFVREEWDEYFSGGRADAAPAGWRGILYANLALAEPELAWAFFTAPGFQQSMLDGGASLSWYLTMAAVLGGL